MMKEKVEQLRFEIIPKVFIVLASTYFGFSSFITKDDTVCCVLTQGGNNVVCLSNLQVVCKSFERILKVKGRVQKFFFYQGKLQ